MLEMWTIDFDEMGLGHLEDLRKYESASWVVRIG
jgi:hypothetical protein